MTTLDELLKGATQGEWWVGQQAVDKADPEAVGERNNSIWAGSKDRPIPVVALSSVRAAVDGEPWVPMISCSPQDAELIVEMKRQFPTLLQRIRDLEEGYRDAVAGLHYVRDNHGDLYGVGFDRVFDRARALLESPNP